MTKYMNLYRTNSVNVASVIPTLGDTFTGLEPNDDEWLMVVFADPDGHLPEIARLYYDVHIAVPARKQFHSVMVLRAALRDEMDAREVAV